MLKKEFKDWIGFLQQNNESLSISLSNKFGFCLRHCVESFNIEIDGDEIIFEQDDFEMRINIFDSIIISNNDDECLIYKGEMKIYFTVV